MKVRNVHERVLAAPPERVAALFEDLEQVWPVQVIPAPKPEGEALRIGPLLWQPVERDGAAAAFRVVDPAEFPAEHWFEVEAADGGTRLRHTVEGDAVGSFEPLWRERIEPFHDAVIEALFDRAEEATA